MKEPDLFVDFSVRQGNVVFNWRRNAVGDLGAFAAGYHRAGQALARQLASSHGYPDYDGYPILFLYRHALELYLKAFVCKGAQLLDLLDLPAPSTESMFVSHGLTRWLPAFRQVLKGMDWSLPADDPDTISIAELESIVHQVERADPKSYTFRYPINTKSEAAHNEHQVINVLVFSERLDQVLTLLDGGLTGLSEAWDSGAELAYEIQGLKRDAT